MRKTSKLYILAVYLLLAGTVSYVLQKSGILENAAETADGEGND